MSKLSTQQVHPARATSRTARDGNGLLTRADIPMRSRERTSSIGPFVNSPSAQGKSRYGRPVKAMATLVEMDCINLIDAIPDPSLRAKEFRRWIDENSPYSDND